jgi:two-component system, NarL family, sensor histidine kinase UhpB
VEIGSAQARPTETDRPRVETASSRLRSRALAFCAWLTSLWHRNSVRTQLLIIVLAIEVAAVLVAGAITILKARTSTRVEIEASTRLAQLFVTEALQLVPADTPPQQMLTSLPQLRFLRHVRISVLDAAGIPVAQASSAAGSDAPAKGERAPAPAWFQALIAPAIERHVVAVTAHGRQIGSVVIASEPNDEIAEVWENTIALAWVALAVNAAVIGALYFLFGRALAPLRGLARGLTDLEHRNYTVRLPAPKTREFVALTTRFNALAHALEAARAENVRLGRRLITAQDDERRHTAIELHDEVGPSLFGLKAIATSIKGVGDKAAGELHDALAERVRDILAIIEHLQAINRTLLNRLRPMALGHVPLGELVSQIIRDRVREHPQIGFSLTAAALPRSYGDTIDLTLYRCVQESLTNAIRHAQAKHIAVRLAEEPGPGDERRVELTIDDDGCGIAADAPRGFGLTGMQERVEVLGGDFAVGPRESGGTRVHVAIAIEDRRREQRDAGGAV